MKKKILSVFMSLFLVFGSTVSSYASPLIALPYVSYELLMGLMGLGVIYGLALPETPEQYDSYTNGLRNHLRLVDEQYIKEFEQQLKDKKFPTEPPSSPGGDKFISISALALSQFDKLFSSVKLDTVNPRTYYVGDDGAKLPLNTWEGGSIRYIPIEGDKVVYPYVNHKGNSVKFIVERARSDFRSYLEVGTNKIFLGETPIFSGVSSLTFVLMTTQSGFIYPNVAFKRNGNIYPMSNPSPYDDGLIAPSSMGKVDLPSIPQVDKKPIVKPDGGFDFDIEEVPSIDIPNINNPNIEVGSKPNPNPGENTCPDCGGENGKHTDSCPSKNPDPGLPPGVTNPFPPWGGGIDFAPITQSSLTDKFPFSLASDIKGIVSIFDVKPRAPQFTVPMVTEELYIDLTEFDLWASIIRFFILLGFIMGLINLTRVVLS